MALCNEITQNNFDSGTSSLQNTPFKLTNDSGFTTGISHTMSSSSHQAQSNPNQNSNKLNPVSHSGLMTTSSFNHPSQSSSSHSKNLENSLNSFNNFSSKNLPELNKPPLNPRSRAIELSRNISPIGNSTSSETTSKSIAQQNSIHHNHTNKNSNSHSNSNTLNPENKNSFSNSLTPNLNNYQTTLSLKQTIQLIESQLDEAQRQAEIEKTLIVAELKSEKSNLDAENNQIKRIDIELETLETQYARKIEILKNNCPSLSPGSTSGDSGKDSGGRSAQLEEFEFQEQKANLETELDGKKEEILEMTRQINSSIDRKKVRIETLKRQLTAIKDQERIEINRLTKQRDICILQLQRVSEKERANFEKRTGNRTRSAIGYTQVCR